MPQEDRRSTLRLPQVRAEFDGTASFHGEKLSRQSCLAIVAPVDSGMDCNVPESATAVRLPWDFHPALTQDRLFVCARLLANARRDALRLAAYEMGDDSWSVGCRAYAFGRQRLKRVAEAGNHGWLSVMDESHHFIFLIDQVPVRFYRGLAEDPTVRTLRRQEAEARQLGLALGDDAAEGLAFRLAVETNAHGAVARVVFLALRGESGAAECVWPIPLDAPCLVQDAAVQLRLLDDEGSDGPSRAAAGSGQATARSRPARRRVAARP